MDQYNTIPFGQSIIPGLILPFDTVVRSLENEHKLANSVYPEMHY